jgi:hypothetical protein
MANNETLGFTGRFAFEPAGTAFDSSAKRFEVVSCSVKKTSEVLDSAGVLGSRTRLESRTRPGLIRVGGQIAFDVSPAMLDYFLPYVLGATESTDTFDVADDLPGFDMLWDKFTSGGSSAEKFGELYVNKMTLRGSPGQPMRMTLDVIGKTYTGGQSYTSAALGSTAATDAPYVYHDTDSGITIRSGSGATAIEEFELTIDNQLDVKFRNSQTATSIRGQDRLVTLVATMPLTTSNLSTYFGDKTAADATIVMTNGTVATTFTLNNYKVADEGPEMGGKDEVPLILHGMARGDSSSTFDIQTTVVGGSL